MSKYKTVEEYAAHVGTVTAKQLAALCRNLGPTHPTTVAIEELCTEAARIVQQGEMRQEQGEEYDLGALRVDVDKPTQSENPFEED